MKVLRVLARDFIRNLQRKVRIPAGFPGRCLLATPTKQLLSPVAALFFKRRNEMISEKDFEELSSFIDKCLVKDGLVTTTFLIFSPLAFVSKAYKGDDTALKELLRQKKKQLQERIQKLGIHAVAHEYYVEAKHDELWDVPQVSDGEFSRQLHQQVEETISLANQIGFTQAAEESYQRGLCDLDRLFLINSEWRNLFGVLENEL